MLVQNDELGWGDRACPPPPHCGFAPSSLSCLSVGLPPPITTLLVGELSMVTLRPSAREEQGVVVVYLTGE